MDSTQQRTKQQTILIVDDVHTNLLLLSRMAEKWGLTPLAFADSREALQAVETKKPDLILLDINMPGMNGYELCRRVKENDKLREIPVIFLSGLTDPLDKMEAFASGGVDYIEKPFQAEEVEARIKAHLKIRSLQLELEDYNRRLRQMVQEKVKEIYDSQMSTILALSKLAESRDDDTGSHIHRVQEFCRTLASHLSWHPDFSNVIDDEYINDIFHASPLHDIGKVGVPDAVLLKPGKLTNEEFEIMKSHTIIGANNLKTVQEKYPNNTFLNMGIEIARSHHEKWDGSGYPDGLSREEIPLSARIIAIADQYDALRNVRVYKPPFSHDKAVSIIVEGDGRTKPEHFDPRILDVFREISAQFAEIFDKMEI